MKPGEERILEADFEEIEQAPAPGKGLVRREMVAGLIRPVAPPAEVLAVQEETRALIETALKEGRDFGNIPGTDKKKKNLLKAGAERVCAAFAVVASYELVEREIDHDRPIAYVKRDWNWHPTERGKKVWHETPGKSEGLYRYVVICRLVHRESGVVIGEGVGSCSTMESKYIDRPRDLENTVLKMAKKRAYVDATLTTFGLSDQFTQDMEDAAAGNGHAAEEDAPAPEFSLFDTLPFGKHKGKTWADLVQDAPDYIEWALEKMNKLTPDAKETLRAALEAKKVPAGAARPAVPLSEPDDDLPF